MAILMHSTTVGAIAVCLETTWCAFLIYWAMQKVTMLSMFEKSRKCQKVSSLCNYAIKIFVLDSVIIVSIFIHCLPHHQYNWEKTIACFVMQIYNCQLSLDIVQVLVLRGNMLLDNNWSYTCPEYKIGNMIFRIIILIIIIVQNQIMTRW